MMDKPPLFTRILRRARWEFVDKPRWRRLRELTDIAHTSKAGLRFFFATNDDFGREVFLRGNYENDSLLEAVSILRTHFNGFLEKTFLDIGANIGTSTITALKLAGFRSAIAVEPEPNNFKLLQINVIANDATSQVRLVNAAISSKEGNVQLEVDERNNGAYRVIVGNQLDITGRSTVSVRALPLAQALASVGATVDDIGLLWMDVQGHEPYVLESCPEITAAGVPACLEFWPAGLRLSGGTDKLTRLLRANYTHFVDVKYRPERERPIADLNAIESQLPGRSWTELLVYRKP
jgi:FkbM family methyltransferase